MRCLKIVGNVLAYSFTLILLTGYILSLIDTIQRHQSLVPFIAIPIGLGLFIAVRGKIIKKGE